MELVCGLLQALLKPRYWPYSLFDEVVKAKMKLIEIIPHEATLEDIFASVTQ